MILFRWGIALTRLVSFMMMRRPAGTSETSSQEYAEDTRAAMPDTHFDEVLPLAYSRELATGFLGILRLLARLFPFPFLGVAECDRRAVF